MNYRSHYCSAIGKPEMGTNVILSGWVSRKRVHGGLLFLDLRDYTGVVQCTVEEKDEITFNVCEEINLESVIQVYGSVAKRPTGKENSELVSGLVEVRITKIVILSKAKELPFPIHQENHQISDELRLKYRFLDMRRQQMSDIIRLRADLIKEMRFQMEGMGFMEVQTPLLTSSSPEGARDFVVPSRLHNGKFYALPQSPQLFKQLLMVGGVEKYYQIAPCFRDEDGRADRAVGAFYQLDMEMAFTDQEMIIQTIEPVIRNIFNKFGNSYSVPLTSFRRITYKESIQAYGTDRPDLRNPLKFTDFIPTLEEFAKSSSNIRTIFGDAMENGMVGFMSLPTALRRKSLDQLKALAISKGAKDMGYIAFAGETRGSLARIFNTEMQQAIQEKFCENDAAGILIAHSNKKQSQQIIQAIRAAAAEELGLIEKHGYRFCWVVDFPMYEENEDGTWDFSHNPFSMPQNLDKLEKDKTGEVLGYQYDLVCNGYEIISGAVRNYNPETMYKVFSLIDLDKSFVDEHFSCMINAFQYGPPPHAGCAAGVDRILMLLAQAQNVRDVIAFPLTQGGLDPLVGAPTSISKHHLDELGIEIKEQGPASDHKPQISIEYP